MYSVFFLVVIMVLLCEIRVHGQTPQSNQGSQGRQRAKPGFRQQITIENRGQRERTQRKRGPETRKHATRVPRSRKEANKGSRGSQRGKQGFPGVEKRQTRVHSGLKEANKGSQGPGLGLGLGLSGTKKSVFFSHPHTVTYGENTPFRPQKNSRPLILTKTFNFRSAVPSL